ncbi:hypothetical protein [Streptomyces sp. CB02261]|uniref:hypothetical protein n=1 Tax=Streptomyces sp. CB02261 TaxID=1703940 RepID=UPI0009389FFE|nr:hypothetical protein [Streptomyces sp. CB02261]OKJ52534.1 hypothetical protein AMK29_30340 [Streptomyces sp. CB02261]
MSDSLSPETIKRLAFVRFLHEQGILQSQQPEPLSATAILSFQDAVEHFLLIAADHLKVNLPSSMQFLQYWERLKPALPDGQDLPSKQALDRVNKIRVALKHYGTIPSSQAILQAKADVSTFFTDATKLIFSVDFTSLDMIDLVTRQQTVDVLRYSQSCMDKGDLGQAMAGLSIAFDDLIDHYTSARQVTYFRRPPFRFGQHLRGYRDQSLRIKQDSGSRQAGLRGLQVFVSDISKQLEDLTAATMSMRRAMQMTALGVDYRRYSQFAMITPVVIRTRQGASFRPAGFLTVTEKDYDFGRAFVIESALQMAKADELMQQHQAHNDAVRSRNRGEVVRQQWEGPLPE